MLPSHRTSLIVAYGRWIDAPHQTHTFGAKGLFDGVKGSPLIRQWVLILALGRFPIDYFTSEIRVSSLNRPTHILPNRSQASAYLAFGVWPRLRRLLLLKTHRCFQSKAREQITSRCEQGRLILPHSLLWDGRGGCRESSIPTCVHKEQFQPANK